MHNDNEQILYLDCSSGISGDMFVAALLDLGADEEKLRKVLDSIPVHGAEIQVSRVKKSGLDACDFLVKLDRDHENHDHDMAYLHGHEHGHMPETEHIHDHMHNSEQPDDHIHEPGHTHGHAVHHIHEHRGLPEILHLLRESSLSERALEIAEKIFSVLAQAEAKAHGTTPDQVHFHEVGAIDSILDIAAAAFCLDNLGVTRVCIPVLTEGTGTVRCQHGILPIPVPAVMNIAENYSLPIHVSSVNGELITPTGAAIAAAVGTDRELPERFIIRKTGLGAGKRNYETAGILRAMLIVPEVKEIPEKTTGDRICRLETDIDDCTGEMLGYVMDRLMEAGARDVHYVPVYMKKNRPAYEVVVICDESTVEQMETILFRETTTIGIRKSLMERRILERRVGEAETPWGPLKVKICRIPGEDKERCYPEYSDMRKTAETTGLSMQDIYRITKKCWYESDGQF